MRFNIDPLELRLPTYAEVDPEVGRPWSSKALQARYQQGAEPFGWVRLLRAPRLMRQLGAGSAVSGDIVIRMRCERWLTEDYAKTSRLGPCQAGSPI